MHQTICLNMIVKNEVAVIARCLDSLRPLIDTWVIVDTGSTDGTQQCIRETLAGLPGELYERPWVHFAHNRSEALVYARGRAEFVLFIDADEMLTFEPSFALPELTADAYKIRMISGAVSYWKTMLVRDSLDWHYIGVLHEYPACSRPAQEDRLPGITCLRFADGARAKDPVLYRRDALLLEEALLTDPQNARNMFYLGQSYADAGETALAIDRYARRVALGGWVEEIWYSLYQIGRLKQRKGDPWPEVLAAYLAAFNFRPTRAEPLFQIGFFYQARKEYAVACLFLSQAMAIPYPESEILFVDKYMYEVSIPLEYSVCSFYVGRHEQAIETANRLLAGEIPPELRDQVIRNREFSLDALRARL